MCTSCSRVLVHVGDSTGIGIVGSTCIGTSGSTCIGIGDSTSIGISTSTCSCTVIGTSAGARDVDYCLTTYGLVRFEDKIYVRKSSELKKVILREFHVKPY